MFLYPKKDMKTTTAEGHRQDLELQSLTDASGRRLLKLVPTQKGVFFFFFFFAGSFSSCAAGEGRGQGGISKELAEGWGFPINVCRCRRGGATAGLLRRPVQRRKRAGLTTAGQKQGWQRDGGTVAQSGHGNVPADARSGCFKAPPPTRPDSTGRRERTRGRCGAPRGARCGDTDPQR